MRLNWGVRLGLSLGLLLAAGCAASTETPVPGATPLSASPTHPAIVPTLAASTATPSPAFTPTIQSPRDQLRAMTDALNTNHTPTFLRWFVFNPIHVETASDNGTLVLTLKSQALWFMNQRGVMLYRLVLGNFRITASVEARRASDVTQPPQGPVVQLGGLMARNPNPGPENYMFIVVGQDVNDLSVETKNTVDSLSKYNGPSWDSSDAELRLCRLGSTFNLYKRHPGESAWTLAQSVERPDMPDILQVGPNIYSDGAPDLQVRYDNLLLEFITADSDCTAD